MNDGYDSGGGQDVIEPTPELAPEVKVALAALKTALPTALQPFQEDIRVMITNAVGAQDSMRQEKDKSLIRRWASAAVLSIGLAGISVSSCVTRVIAARDFEKAAITAAESAIKEEAIEARDAASRAASRLDAVEAGQADLREAVSLMAKNINTILVLSEKPRKDR